MKDEKTEALKSIANSLSWIDIWLALALVRWIAISAGFIK